MPLPSMSQAKNWIFTLNNYTPLEYEKLCEGATNPLVVYLIVGKEVGTSGTPHLQGFVSLAGRSRLNPLKTLLGSDRYHLEVARGSAEQNRTYCSKEGDFLEFGTSPVGQGKRSDLDKFYDWGDQFYQDNQCRPSYQQVCENFPNVVTKFPGILKVLYARLPQPKLRPNGVPRPWQAQVLREITESPDDRSVTFYVDHEGNSGKTWLQQHMLDVLPDRVQILGIGKRDDMAHMVDETKNVFLINVPRGSMEYLQYTVLEMLKDRLVVSPKYQSMVKVLNSPPHIYIFSNEDPDFDKMTADRYVIRTPSLED